MQMKRREFIGTAAAGAAAVWLGTSAPARAAAPGATDLVPLGPAIKACRISCGTGMAGGNRETNQTRMGAEKFEALLNYAYEKGVRHFDLADLYGTHPYVARAMKGKPRAELQYTTKIWTQAGGIPESERPPADEVVKRFLDELQTDYLDLVQIHCMTDPQWTTVERKQMDALAQLKADGLIRSHGCSVHSLEALKLAAEEPWVDVVHARVNPYNHRTDADIEEVVPVLKRIKENGKGLIGMKLVGEGSFDEGQRAKTLDFVMGLGVIDCMTVGFEQPGQIDEFVSAVQARLDVA
ncbi:MAG: aldo/keto reductase [Candidatus Hydrogenedens sp.]|nr:aldo/keto reductase [Candidatus Hydrogenedens sp.]